MVNFAVKTSGGRGFESYIGHDGYFLATGLTPRFKLRIIYLRMRVWGCSGAMAQSRGLLPRPSALRLTPSTSKQVGYCYLRPQQNNFLDDGLSAEKNEASERKKKF